MAIVIVWKMKKKSIKITDITEEDKIFLSSIGIPLTPSDQPISIITSTSYIIKLVKDYVRQQNSIINV